MTISEYLQNINRRFITGISREHTYRGDLQALIETIAAGIQVTNEPARIACGAPDYVLTQKDVPVGYIEAKDIGVDLNGKHLKEQFDRYKAGLSNLIFTDYLDFHFYKDGVLTTSVAIAAIAPLSGGQGLGLRPKPENFERFTSLIQNFTATISQTIKSPTKLAEMMAGKAKLMADVIEKSLKADDENETRSALKSQMLSFQQMLIHDITNAAFADIYSQTIAYGMFAARYHDPTLATFSRQEAATLIPKSNPFLRKLFQDIAGYDLDGRLVWIVDELVNIFLATDVADIMRNFGKSTKQEDPVVHFYETFLAAYNPALRKARGVWYTPQPVVNFIVRAVDDLLKTEFNLPQGLADTTKIKIKTKHVTKATADRKSILKEVEYEQEVHKVQILDPATGTGTFLAEVVRLIHKKFEGQQGIWSNYVNQHLIPRLNGFELLMASYAMAHLKMDMLLTETGYKATTDQRFRIFLTNSLEEYNEQTYDLWAQALADESNQANAIKRDTPVMVVMGNPPYAVSSTNKSDWIQNLIADYKKDLNERKINLDDDYIKFIRFGQHFIDKTGEGILAYISNNSFIDGITHRQMRKHLLESFDQIYILDLHGNSHKKEKDLNGAIDQNVFDIMQGVSINIFIKNRKKVAGELGKVFHASLFGKRESKYSYLNENTVNTISWTELYYGKPNYFFNIKDFIDEDHYKRGFKLDELFIKYNSGIQTKRDTVTIHNTRPEIEKVVKYFIENEIENIRSRYVLPADGRDWTIKLAKQDLIKGFTLIPILYRPFDKKITIYTGRAKGFIAYPREKTTKDFVERNNLALIFERSSIMEKYSNIFITNSATDLHVIGTAFSNGYIGALYTYIENSGQQLIDTKTERVSNLKKEIIKGIAENLNLTFTNEKETIKNTFAPIDLLDYIYAVLHSPAYREKYKEFLKIDFPRVPYPLDVNEFWRLVQLGGELRQLHLLESPKVQQYITQYPEDGTNVVGKIRFELQPDSNTGKVWINEAQYFAGVPQTAWTFYIGGYQPAQKWLKDRKDRELSFEDILHYQQMIVALVETDRLMEEIDEVEGEVI